MNEQEFWSHHGLSKNPFADEDAQTDTVFKDACIDNTYHPAWSKVFGDPSEPSTAIVFGAKGSGKTAIRLQLGRHYSAHNAAHPDKRLFIVEYDDFNKYLGPLEQHLSRGARGKPDKILQAVRLWDHMDAILCEGVTELVDDLLDTQSYNSTIIQKISTEAVDKLDRGQKRDLLLLAAFYDQSRVGTLKDRWSKLRKKLRYQNFATWLDVAAAVLMIAVAASIHYVLLRQEVLSLKAALWTIPLSLLVAWMPYLIRFSRNGLQAWKICRRMRVGKNDFWTLTRTLMSIPSKELASQPMPTANRTDDRYALLEKFQLLLRSLGFQGLIVLMDRFDEPDAVNGQPERIRQLVWPLLDNKLLKHPGLGIKLLLPKELEQFVNRESREFHERARLDKQNVVGGFNWTGEALYDVVAARLKACSNSASPPRPSQLFDPAISEPRLLSMMQSLQTPRNLFRFLYRLVADHCKRYRTSEAKFQIAPETFESTLAVYLAEVERSAP